MALDHVPVPSFKFRLMEVNLAGGRVKWKATGKQCTIINVITGG